MLIDADRDPEAPGSREHICWCVLTQNCLGPDGQVADQGTCNMFRSCYAAA